MASLKLSYFDAPGRAEPIRIALRLGGVAFEDDRMQFPAFMAAKAGGALPLGSVPVLQVDDIAITQTAAILRYAARIGDTSLYPADPQAALWVDSVIDCFNDSLSQALVPTLFEKDTDKKLAMRADIANGIMKRVFTYTESILARSGGPFVAGNTLSIADIVVARQVLQIRTGALDGVAPSYLDAFPGLSALADAYLADPRIAAL